MRRVLHAAAAAIICATAAACSQNQPPMPPEDITDVTWTLIEVNGSPVDQAAMNRPATLTLDGEGRASGYGGCNQFGGEYTLNGSELTFGPIAMTRMACERGMDIENQFGAVFDATRSWRVTDGMLELLDGDTVLARFRR